MKNLLISAVIICYITGCQSNAAEKNRLTTPSQECPKLCIVYQPSSNNGTLFVPLEDLLKNNGRVWKFSELGITPNLHSCYSDRFQELLDSAAKLPGFTIFEIDKPGYYGFARPSSLNWALLVSAPNVVYFPCSSSK